MTDARTSLPPMPGFATLFEALWGMKPFSWQQELAESVSDEGRGWPSLLDVPTGLGKTAALDVFLWHLAAQADRTADQRSAPTRAAFVVDRRLVVDGAYERMRQVAQRLQRSADPTISAVAGRLRAIGGSRVPLVVQRMRGGVTWEANWVKRTDQPAIVCGTVDQVGSRLLCRGYGTTSTRLPIDAGLLGADCLLMLDEAHLSSPLMQTMRGIEAIECRAPERVLPARSGRMVRLTATPSDSRDEPPGGVLRVDAGSPDAHSGVAQLRLIAEKRTVLVGVPKASDLAARMADLAAGVLAGDARIVLVVANTVATARSVFEHVASRAGGVDRQLLIGRCRSLERRHGEAAWLPRAIAGRDRSADRPLLVVATQTVEVGVDLDVDSLITEVASVDALVQRFGRVDRLGMLGLTHSVVVGVTGKTETDPVYGLAGRATWDLLARHAEPISPPKAARKGPSVVEQLRNAPWFDAGPLAFRELVDEVAERHRIVAPSAPAPVVVPQTLACWMRTSPVPEPDESVAAYLHGVGRGDPVVAVAWRAGRDPSALRRSVERYPVRSDELVEVPFRAMLAFLSSRAEASWADDAESVSSEEAETDAPVGGRDQASASDVPAGVVVRSRGEVIEGLRDVRRSGNGFVVRPGDVVVLACDAGGHDRHGWTGRRGESPVPDIADLVERSVLRLRLDDDVLAAVGAVSAEVRSALTGLQRIASGDDPSTQISELLSSLSSVLAGDRQPGATPARLDLRRVVEQLAEVERWPMGPVAGGPATLVVEALESDDDDEIEFVRGLHLVARRPDPQETADGPVADGELDDDDDDSSLLGVDLGLLRHVVDVADRAAELGRNAGLPDSLVSTLRFAGFLHDLGKADARFQAMLRSGDVIAARAAGDRIERLLAKSALSRDDVGRARAAQRASGWPRLRHEAISLELARSWPAGAVPAGVDVDLARHLVATHHGHGRPWFPADREDPAPERVRLVITGLDVARGTGASIDDDVIVEASSGDALMAFDQPDRLDRLRRRYGFWGLCLLEAVLRLADMTVSEELVVAAHGGRRG